MDQLFKIISFFLLNFTYPAIEATQSINCAPALQKHLDAIQKLPEAQHLFDAISKEGPICILSKYDPYSQRFKAFWDPDKRLINIDLYEINTDGLVIAYLLLELHNASTNSYIHHLTQLAIAGKIPKSNYIESMEYLEYVNAVNASNLAKIGITKGLFPADSSLPTFASFEEHFAAQKISGHSACYDYNYERYSKLKRRS